MLKKIFKYGMLTILSFLMIYIVALCFPRVEYSSETNYHDDYSDNIKYYQNSFDVSYILNFSKITNKKQAYKVGRSCLKKYFSLKDKFTLGCYYVEHNEDDWIVDWMPYNDKQDVGYSIVFNETSGEILYLANGTMLLDY